ncbi:MBL fold metallo-hydrolase [bacterium]|nr:MBL fold metallo-hydrolase [candidate division CSSED10-310 bacterium]
MYFRQFTVDGLGCFSYMLGCPASGIACVVDPERHIDRYLTDARKSGLTITHIFDTHLHADHVSGALDLSRVTGAPVYVHPAIQAEYPHMPVREGDAFTFGTARVEILETPGHTPNSITLVVSDLSRSESPLLLLTGDLLFVGDIGRPDLAGEAMLEEQVKNLYDSLYVKLGRFPDYIEIYPAHGKGSLCGKGMSAKPMSTLGFERRWNMLLDAMDFATFRAIMTQEFQTRPPGFVSIVEKNRRGPELIGRRLPLRELGMQEVEDMRSDADVRLVDIRPATEFGAAFIPGSINIGLVANSAMWLGMSLDSEKKLIIIGNRYSDALEAEKQYRRVGFDAILGCLASGIAEYVASGYDLAHLPQLTVDSMKHVLETYPDHTLIDLRTPMEQKADPFEGAIHIPFQEFMQTGIDLPPHTHVTMVCGTGFRSNIAGSFLKARGYPHVFCLMGGTSAWNEAHRNKRAS